MKLPSPGKILSVMRILIGSLALGLGIVLMFLHEPIDALTTPTKEILGFILLLFGLWFLFRDIWTL
jgi:hypothetical protein